jgi:acyl-CoA reductase-like NAD-dependent aldehyde dehydrogenase
MVAVGGDVKFGVPVLGERLSQPIYLRRAGSLRPGLPADITVFRVDTGTYEISDCYTKCASSTRIAMSEKPIHVKMLIAGQRVSGHDQIEVRNPANPEEIVGTVPRGTGRDAERAIAAAKAAQPAWAKRSFVERAKILGEALDRFAAGTETRARLYARENGRVLAEALGELRGVPIAQKLTLELAPELDSGRQLKAPTGRTFVNYLPYGVVVSIVPWNAPVTLAFLHVIPALLAGNGVVVKPPESCPLALVDSLGVMPELLPAGLLNVVTGRSSDLGEVLTTHPDVAKIGFTGGIPAARRIMANAAQSIKGVTLELGGNDPAIVLDDVDLADDTMKRMAHGVFAATGQVCMGIKRIYLPESKSKQFVEAFTRMVDRYIIGDGLEPAVTMGPMHTRKGRDDALALIEDCEKRGAKVNRLGSIHNTATFDRGYFVRPTVVTEIGDDAPLMTQEQFCPAIPITTYRDLDDVISRSNDTYFGLCASVWSCNIDRALEVARRMEAGTIFVNAHGVTSVNRRAPYGGIKQSGIGRKASLEGVLEYLQMQTITTHGVHLNSLCVNGRRSVESKRATTTLGNGRAGQPGKLAYVGLKKFLLVIEIACLTVRDDRAAANNVHIAGDAQR